jgi:hypothetical protein
MSDEMIMLATWVVAGLVSVTVCGIVSAAAGTSFWGGFWFGPIGILISVVRRMSEQRPRVVVIGGSRIAPRFARRGSVPTPPREPTEVERFDAWFDAQGGPSK